MEQKYNQKWNASESGMTFLELLLAVVVLAMVLISIPTSFRTSTQIWDRGDRHAEVLQNALIGMEEITRELRQAKGITSYSSNSYIEFEDKDELTGRFELSDSHLETGDGVDADVLSGPIDSLTFTLYDEHGNPVTIDDEIRAVRIDMNTFDDQGKVDDIPLSSLVYIRDWVEHRVDEFAIFGGLGVGLINGVEIDGNVGSNGYVDLRNGSDIDGNILHLGDLILQNPDQIDFDLDYFGYINLPIPTVFSAGGDDITTGNNETTTLGEGSYGVLDLGNNNVLNLESGNYYFESIVMGTDLELNIDLELGNIQIFVEGKAETKKGLIVDLEGGGAAQVYAETHYPSDFSDLDDFAWNIGGNGGNSEWFGTVYAPYGHITVTDGTVVGSLYAGGYIGVHNGSTIEYVASEYLMDRW